MDVLSNLIAWIAQTACIVGVGVLVAAAARTARPVVRYAYWRALLVLCLALPWIQGRAHRLPAATSASQIVSIVLAPASRAASRSPGSLATLPVIVLTVLVAGALLRLAWIGVGLFGLRRLRGASQPPDAAVEDFGLQATLGTNADLRYLRNHGQPVTFGLRRPIVLLPDTLRAHGCHLRCAVLCHELLHVRRRDWAWLLAEEALRALLWFHPAVWWLISRIQLAREEVVDDLVVRITGRRRTYMEALMAFADQTPLAPVAAFARRRQLFRRMMLISKENEMSIRRLVFWSVVAALVMSGAVPYAVRAFPLTQAGPDAVVRAQPGPLESHASPISPDNPVPRRLVGAMPPYPAAIASDGLHGVVTLVITLDASGHVAELRWRLTGTRFDQRPIDATRALAAINTLGRAATDAVRQWVYDPPAAAPITFGANIAFAPDAEPLLVAHGFPVLTPAPQSATVSPPPSPPPPPPGWAQDAIRISGDMKPPTKIKDAKAVYPPEAKAEKVQGVVVLEARIGADGKVSNTRVLRSSPLLDQAAIDAVMQWEFIPALLNGVPHPVLVTITVNFTLQ